MENSDLLRKISSSNAQIERLNNAISTTEENKGRIPESVYNAAIASYKSVIKGIEEEIKNYRTQLQLVR
jgi:hypothetical protein